MWPWISNEVLKPDEVIGHFSLSCFLHVLAIVLDHLGHLVPDPPIKQLRVVLGHVVRRLRAVVRLRQIVVPAQYRIERISNDNNRSIGIESCRLLRNPRVMTLYDPDRVINNVLSFGTQQLEVHIVGQRMVATCFYSRKQLRHLTEECVTRAWPRRQGYLV